MILKYMVLLFFLCFFATSRGDVIGDIEQRLSALEENMKSLENTVKSSFRDIKKLLNDQNDWTIIEKIPKLTTAEIVHYQQFEAGKKGIKIYATLEGIRDGKIKENVIPILKKLILSKTPHGVRVHFTRL